MTFNSYAMNSVGFTGTRKGMTPGQLDKFIEILDGLYEDFTSSFHHGMCVGADAQAHNIAVQLKYWVVGHPPVNVSLMATTLVPHETRRPLPYLQRDDEIVRESDILIATPRSTQEVMRGSGTWYTVRRARASGTPCALIFPDGSVRYEEGRC